MGTTDTTAQPAATDSAAGHVDSLVTAAHGALRAYLSLTQEQIDHIVKKAVRRRARPARPARPAGRRRDRPRRVRGQGRQEHLRLRARSPTRMHGLQDRRRDRAATSITGIVEIAEPVGVVCGITPGDQPDLDHHLQGLIALKTRNPIIFAFHPAAQQCSAEAAAGRPRRRRSRPARPSTASSGSSSRRSRRPTR